jgi:hypothetical protein
MDNKSMQEYQKLYSEYVEQLVIVHNYHSQFVKNLSFDSGQKLRVALAAMSRLQTKMKVACLSAFREKNKSLKEQRKKTYGGFTLPEKRGPGNRKNIKTDVDIPKSDSGGTS